MNEVVGIFGLEPPKGSYLCGIDLYRRADGSIQASLQTMDGALIDTTGHDVASRVAIVAGWLSQGSADLSQQSIDWLIALKPPEDERS